MARCARNTKRECSAAIVDKSKVIMQKIGNKMKAEARKLGFSEKEYAIISILWREKKITLNDVCSRAGLPKSTVSRLAEKLVSGGVVKRTVPKNNRRSIELSLEENFRRKKSLLNAVINELSESADAASLRKILSGLDEFEKILN